MLRVDFVEQIFMSLNYVAFKDFRVLAVLWHAAPVFADDVLMLALPANHSKRILIFTNSDRVMTKREIVAFKVFHFIR